MNEEENRRIREVRREDYPLEEAEEEEEGDKRW